MGEAAKKVLAYQREPLVLTCEHAGIIPEDVLSTLTRDEEEYVLARAASPLEPVFYELLPRLGAAGVLTRISGLIYDVHRASPVVRTDVDGVSLPVLEEDGVESFFRKEYFEPFVTDLKRVLAKTEQRFDEAHLVHLCALPRFLAGRPVEHEIAVFGELRLDDAAYAPEELRPLYEESLVARFSGHTWVGVHPKFFLTQTLRAELVERLARLGLQLVPA